jgi:hypothetical protein
MMGGKVGFFRSPKTAREYNECAITREELIECIIEAESTRDINLLRGPGNSNTNSLAYTLSRRIHNQNTPASSQAVNPTFGMRQGLTTDKNIIRQRLIARHGKLKGTLMSLIGG